ncbi:SdpI family protein [Caminicella sporogenes]|uniref:SdpI family protein n=1 Tax=Caminicella sporogenes TaxID=166485 RepID=UPI0025406859|nr:SdpI family protein [Caminicella sporogenes]WIF95893.1 SdpI family protein [Caminicella sporogenes]
MKINKFIIILIFLSILGTVFIYNSLPDKVATHFDFRGQPDKYSSKSYVIFTSLSPLAIYLFMTFLPSIDPKKNSYLKHKKAYEVTKISIVLFMIVLNWSIIMIALGFNINLSVIVRILIGILFIVIGNFMSQIRHNYFFGIKTPWTLASEFVWKKTHRVGAFSFIIGGLLIIVTSLTKGILGLITFILAMIIVIFYPMLYSYIEFKKISKE